MAIPISQLISDWNKSVNFSPSESSMSVPLYPTNLSDCMSQIDSGFGTDYAKTLACNIFLSTTDPNVLNGMAQSATAANQTKYAGWCFTKAQSGSGCQPKTCAQLVASCGTISDGCGNVLDCGDCTEDNICQSNQCQKQPPNGVYPDLPKTNSECLNNLDYNMPQSQKVSTCKELFNTDNTSADFEGFGEDAQKAGYPIASLWFFEKSKQATGNKTDTEDKKDYTLYYVAGGIGALAIIGITIGALAAK